ncbi:myo-inositol 2-dehydrogenase (plasmid) [Sinorhizobium fredii NGR234]|uniref:Myo-inositol 2-dehydrogenase n=1 Tax=Sinorhizobium fredii (strain NBRC 101917 / NGR234) TaxID=394 RepID=Q6W1K8_SINFN|nr:inositol 2-dehydrogenase [Sinorhizobium fredii]AAQ87360.1 Myo-inositol 2-dehydrogenase [Sinorhizobium fredii NGR234]ACP21898.1 myo-inositol 2-dehydrogenase [Sinorhizobium fredii NGR234]
MFTKQSHLRVAVFGAGRMGAIHAATLVRRSDACLAGIVDAHLPSAERLAAEHGVRVLEEDAVFDDEDVDAVVIASAADSHPHLILRSVAARKAIFCEKPLARDLEAVQSVAKVVEATKLPFLLAFNRRFDPDFVALASRLRGGEIGAVELAILTSRDPSPPPIDYVVKSGGVFRETTIHDIDVARWLTGEEPISVHATASALTTVAMKEAKLPDTVVVTMTMPSGAIVSINNSWRAAYGYDQRVEVLGELGMLKLANRLQNGVTQMGASGTWKSNPEPFFLERYANAYNAELDYFISALWEGRTISPGVADGVKALQIAYAAEQSARTGQTVTLG